MVQQNISFLNMPAVVNCLTELVGNVILFLTTHMIVVIDILISKLLLILLLIGMTREILPTTVPDGDNSLVVARCSYQNGGN